MAEFSKEAGGVQRLEDAAFDVRDFRRALGAFVTGVTVVTTISDGAPRGFTANSFTSVSLDPPLVLVCIGKSSSNFEAFATAQTFAINILSDQQREVSRNFAARIEDRFAAVRWRRGDNGAPIIDGSAAWLECDMEQRVEAGDHIVLFGRVRAFGQERLSPLGFCRGNYVIFQLEQDVIAAGKEVSRRVGVILETPDGVILLRNGADGTFSIPFASKLGSREANDGLYGVLFKLGISFEIDFLYSVFDDDKSGVTAVYYRGQASSETEDPRVALVPLHAIPYDDLDDDAVRMLVGRYVEERAEARFSLYSGNSEKGQFWTVAKGRPWERI